MPRSPSPEKRKVQHQFRYAVARGVVARPLFCEQCGGGGNIDGHHDDYDKPLEVRWLCRRCHFQEHGGRVHKPHLTHCKHGHEFTEDNTYLYRGRRQCRACARARKKRTYWAVRAA